MSQAGIINAGGGGGGGGGPVDEITGNSGTAVADVNNNINLVTANTTVKFLGLGSTVTQDFGLSNLVLGSSLPAAAGAAANVGIGQSVLNNITTGNDNVAIGTNSGASLISSSDSTLIGYNAGNKITRSNDNTAIGFGSLSTLTTDGGNLGSNTALGSASAANLVTGIYNLVLGRVSGSFYTGSESSNILLMNSGVAAENNVIRIGTQGTGNGQQNTAFMAGIVNNTLVGSPVCVTASGQLGISSAAPVWQTVSITLTSAQIKTIHGTPITLIPAPGVGKSIVVSSAIAKLNYGGNNAFVAGGGSTLSLFYNNTVTNLFGAGAFVPSAMLTSTANKFTIAPFVSNTITNEAVGVVDNVNVAIYNSVATEISGNAAGDNTIEIQAIYTIYTY